MLSKYGRNLELLTTDDKLKTFYNWLSDVLTLAHTDVNFNAYASAAFDYTKQHNDNDVVECQLRHIQH